MTFSRCTILFPWLAVVVFSMSAQAATYTWDGGGANASLGTAENWVGDAVPPAGAHDYIFSSTSAIGTSLNWNFGNSQNPRTIVFDSNSLAYAISGTATIQLTTATTVLANNSSSNISLSNPIHVFYNSTKTFSTGATANATTFSLGSVAFRPDSMPTSGFNNQLTLTGANSGSITNITDAAAFTAGVLRTINKTGAGTWSITGNITSQAAMNVSAGKLILSGANTYGLATTINSGGIVQVKSNAALGPSTVNEANKTDIKAGGALEVNGNLSIGEFIRVAGTGVSNTGGIRAILGVSSLNAQIAMEGTGGATVSFGVDTGATLKVAKLYSDPGRDTHFEKVGSGKLILTSNESDNYIGTTTISAGTLQVGDGGTTGELKSSAAVSNNAALVFNRSNAYDFTGAISGTGALEQEGSDTLTLSGTSTYTGGTTVSSGTLLVTGQLGNTATTVKDGASIGGDGSIAGSLHFDAGANLIFDATQPLTVNGSTVTFGGFGVTDLVGFDGNVALGTYTLINGTASISTTNLLHFGIENAYNIGAGKQAYFSTGSLQLVVIPESSTLLLGLFGSLALMRRQRSYSI